MPDFSRRLQRADEFLFGGAKPEVPFDIRALKQRGIKTIISLDEMEPKIRRLAQVNGLRVVSMPLRDEAAPTEQQARLFLRKVKREAGLGRPVYVHCHAGIGRTRTMLALHLISRGMLPLEAFTRVGTVESLAQKEAVLSKLGKQLFVKAHPAKRAAAQAKRKTGPKIGLGKRRRPH